MFISLTFITPDMIFFFLLLESVEIKSLDKWIAIF